VVVHCAAGLGRSGTFAACLLLQAGMEPAAAIAAVRAGGFG
jgi:protein-tyrosine phosphatase